MKDEIKEILRDLEFASGIFDYTITPDRCTFLKDYITNLQNRITELEEINKQHQELNAKLRDELENSCWDEASVRADILLEQQDYEERCQKAIEYINKYDNIKAYYEYVECGYDEYNYDDDFKTELLNILQDKEEV